MIYRKPTVIQIKAEEDMQDIQPASRSSVQFTPINPVKGRFQELRHQMEMERPSFNHSPYNNDMMIYHNLMSNIRDE